MFILYNLVKMALYTHTFVLKMKLSEKKKPKKPKSINLEAQFLLLSSFFFFYEFLIQRKIVTKNFGSDLET